MQTTSSLVVLLSLVSNLGTVCKNRYLEKDNNKFYVLIYEAHRSLYNAMYKYMREVLPNASLIAFTGTPLNASSIPVL